MIFCEAIVSFTCLYLSFVTGVYCKQPTITQVSRQVFVTDTSKICSSKPILLYFKAYMA